MNLAISKSINAMGYSSLREKQKIPAIYRNIFSTSNAVNVSQQIIVVIDNSSNRVYALWIIQVPL